MGLLVEKGAKKAVQKRSQITRDKIMQAMDELLQVESFEVINIAKLSTTAGVSAASIYQRFENKDALISILIALYIEKVRVWNEVAQNQPDVQSAENLREVLLRIALAAWRQFEALSYVMRPAYLYSRLRPELLGGHWQAQEKRALHGFEAMLNQWAGELAGRNIAQVAAMVSYFYNMMFLGKLMHNDAQSSWNLGLGAEEFAENLADFVMGYLEQGRR
ncbi:MAG: TetR family transcriptional regulator [Hyphomicrobiales bacterium]|nr:MAG: TetR family transcriptional regulator [Hyphomicrobiales bacterium]